ncbi:MAG: M20/M25/M40 family metallo-hydrolase [Mycoplasmatales bacterium]
MKNKFIAENTLYFQKFAQELFENPELGFKEIMTKEKIIKFIKEISPETEIFDSNTTGFKFSIGNGPLTIGVVAELDAVYSPTHFCANKATGAAHNCGHYSQVVMALYMFKYLVDSQEPLENKITFVFTPAEEFLDLEYRKELFEAGKVTALCGKIDMIRTGFVEEIDLFYSFHSMIDCEYDFSLGVGLVAFDFIDVEFTGVPAHAGVNPHDGVNALDSAVEFYQFLRELEQKFGMNQLRLNPIIECPLTYNVVVPNAVVSTYLRVADTKILKDIYKQINEKLADLKVTKKIKHELKKTEGYMEFKQDKYLTYLVKDCFENVEVADNQFIFAGGDIGDFSYLVPTIQVGYAGFSGAIHGVDFKESRTEYLYTEGFRQLLEGLLKIDKEVDKTKLYKRTKEEYEEYKKGEINE